MSLNLIMKSHLDQTMIMRISEEPLLWREGTDSELNYPYDLGGLATITNSTAGPQFSYYYFFYEWKIEPLPIHCESERSSATASITGVENVEFLAPELFPNPALIGSEVRISNMPNYPCTVQLMDVQGRIIATSNNNIISLNGVSSELS